MKTKYQSKIKMYDIIKRNYLLNYDSDPLFDEENNNNQDIYENNNNKNKLNKSITFSNKSNQNIQKKNCEPGEIISENEKSKNDKNEENYIEDDAFGAIGKKRTKEEEEELNKIIMQRYEKLLEKERIKNEQFLQKKREAKKNKSSLSSKDKNSVHTTEEINFSNSLKQIKKLKNELQGEPKKKIITISNSLCNSQEKDDFSTLSSIKNITNQKIINSQNYNHLHFDIEKERKKLEEMILDIQEKQNNKKDYLKILYDKHNEQIDLKKCYKFNDIYETIDKMDVETLQLGTFYYIYLVGKIIQNAENNILYTDNIQKKLVIRKKK